MLLAHSPVGPAVSTQILIDHRLLLASEFRTIEASSSKMRCRFSTHRSLSLSADMKKELLLLQMSMADSRESRESAWERLVPGATNLLTGVADADMDRSPLIVITGQGSTDRLHKESH